MDFDVDAKFWKNETVGARSIFPATVARAPRCRPHRRPRARTTRTTSRACVDATSRRRRRRRRQRRRRTTTTGRWTDDLNAARDRWEFSAPKFYDFNAADDASDDEWFESAAVKNLSTPKRAHGRAKASTATVVVSPVVRATDPTCAFMRSPASRGKNGDSDRANSVRARGAVDGKGTPRTGNARLGAPRRMLAMSGVKASAGEDEEATTKTPGVRRSPRLALLAQLSAEKSVEANVTSSSGPSTTAKASSVGNTSRYEASGGGAVKRLLKSPKPKTPRAVRVAKLRSQTAQAMTTEDLEYEASKRARAAEQARMRRERKMYGAAPAPEPTSRLTTRAAKNVGVEPFRSRKEKLRAFETGGRTTDYEDLTLIPARTETTKAVSPYFTATRRKIKILTTEERELQEIAQHKVAMEEERKRRRSVYTPCYTTVRSKVGMATSTATRRTTVKASEALVEYDAAEEVRRARNRRTSAPSMIGVQATPIERKRKRISVTSSVLTEITPFRLNTEQRGAYHERKFARRIQEEEDRRNSARAPFKPTPVPRAQQAGITIDHATLDALRSRRTAHY